MSTSSTNAALGNPNARSTPQEVALQLQTQSSQSYISVRIYTIALSAGNGVALMPNLPVPTSNNFRLDMLPSKMIARTDDAWKKPLRNTLVTELRGANVFNRKSLKIEDRTLLPVFETNTGGTRQACAVMACRFEVDPMPARIGLFTQMDKVDRSKVSSLAGARQSGLNKTLHWYRAWRDKEERPKGLGKKICGIFETVGEKLGMRKNSQG